LGIRGSVVESDVYTKLKKLDVQRIFGDASVTIAQWRIARDLTDLGYPQVPDSIPVETPSTQINMDLSK